MSQMRHVTDAPCPRCAARFEQVMEAPKEFALRVGLRHRTLGVEAADGHIAWFWVGTIDDFRRMTEAMA